MGKAYMGGGRAANAVLLGKHPPAWFERAQPPIPGWLNGDLRAGHVINQPKQTEYRITTGTIYTIDGYRIQLPGDTNSVKLAVGNGVTVTANAGGAAIVQGVQLTEPAGTKITWSVEIAEITETWYLWCNVHGASGPALQAFNLRDITEPGIYSLAIALPEGVKIAYFGVARQNGTITDGSARITRMKPEFGDHFTGWYETDPADELVRCQRQYVRWGPYMKAGLAVGRSAASATGYIFLPQMRATPVIRHSNLTLSTDNYPVTDISISTHSPNLIELNVMASNIVNGTVYAIRVSAGGYLELDARL